MGSYIFGSCLHWTASQQLEYDGKTDKYEPGVVARLTPRLNVARLGARRGVRRAECVQRPEVGGTDANGGGQRRGRARCRVE